MKEKTSITLSKEILAAIDRMVGSKQKGSKQKGSKQKGSKQSRSAFIEAVLARYLRQQARAQIEARDLELINNAADELNEEVEDVLRYQQT
jgi:metal-responsive CopG/Arc/MetJ family transcriptional regulator